MRNGCSDISKVNHAHITSGHITNLFLIETVRDIEQNGSNEFNKKCARDSDSESESLTECIHKLNGISRCLCVCVRVAVVNNIGAGRSVAGIAPQIAITIVFVSGLVCNDMNF